MKPALTLALLAGLSASACAPFARPGSSADAVDGCGLRAPELAAFSSIPSRTLVDGQRVGGLSGVTYERDTDSYIFVSDDRGGNGGPRVFRAKLTLKNRSLEVKLTASSPQPQRHTEISALRTDRGPTIDAEAVRFDDTGTLYWASEGDVTQGQGPGLFRRSALSATGEPLPLPSLLSRDAAGRTGPRDNRSFEAIDVVQGQVWLGLEAPLIEAGEPPTTSSGAWTDLVLLSRSGDVVRRYLYPLGPIADRNASRRADNGLAELLALPDDRFLTLERSGSEQRDGSFRFVTRLFCAEPYRAVATSIGTRRLRKRLIVELNALGPFDTANFEGMTFGAPLRDGRTGLVLVADNDFRDDRDSIIALLHFGQ